MSKSSEADSRYAGYASLCGSGSGSLPHHLHLKFRSRAHQFGSWTGAVGENPSLVPRGSGTTPKPEAFSTATPA